MTKKLTKSRYSPKYNIKPTTEKSNFDSSNLPSNLPNFKQKLLSGYGYITYK